VGLSGFSLKREWARLSEQNDVQPNFTGAILFKRNIVRLSEPPGGEMVLLRVWQLGEC